MFYLVPMLDEESREQDILSVVSLDKIITIQQHYNDNYQIIQHSGGF